MVDSVAALPELDLPSTPPKVQQSLLNRYGRGSVTAALTVFLLNMGGAWWLAWDATQAVNRPLVGSDSTATSRAIDAAPTASANTHILLNRVMDNELQLRHVQNRQVLSVVAMAAAFALMAIGFALFVMGAEGAFQVEGGVSSKGNIILKATAPGLLCFLLSAVVLVMSLSDRVDVRTGTFQLQMDPPNAPMQDQKKGLPPQAGVENLLPQSQGTGHASPEVKP